METSKCGWPLIGIGGIGVTIWMVLSGVLFEMIPDAHGEPVWVYYPFLLPLGILLGLPLMAGLGILIVYLAQEGTSVS